MGEILILHNQSIKTTLYKNNSFSLKNLFSKKKKNKHIQVESNKLMDNIINQNLEQHNSIRNSMSNSLEHILSFYVVENDNIHSNSKSKSTNLKLDNSKSLILNHRIK